MRREMLRIRNQIKIWERQIESVRLTSAKKKILFEKFLEIDVATFTVKLFFDVTLVMFFGLRGMFFFFGKNVFLSEKYSRFSCCPKRQNAFRRPMYKGCPSLIGKGVKSI